MINYIKNSFKRKKARRVTKEYPYSIDTFDLKRDGAIKFANWENPLAKKITLTQPEVDFFRSFINEGDVVIDIGANIGDTTVPMALAAGKTGITFGFDPNPYVYKILEVNAGLNENKTNIIPMLNAISAEDQDFYYISSEASFANGGISPTKDSAHGSFTYPNKVKGINLLNYFEKKYPELLDRISFIKIDTEGYDKEIIKSISDLIIRYKPRIIAESFGKSPNEAKMEMYDVISQHGYTIYFFEEFKKGTMIKEIKTSDEMTKWSQTINIYALPKNQREK